MIVPAAAGGFQALAASGQHPPSAALREEVTADRAADRAARAELEQDSAVRLIEEQLAEASQRLSQARRQRREAESARLKARQALDRPTH
jgi:hypothetical protein